jgi:hypothetical protein
MTMGERNAIARALARRGAAAVSRVRYGVYRIESHSRPGQWHTVTVDALGGYRCDCEAAVAGRPACWHRALVFVLKTEHASKGRVTASASPTAAAPAPAGARRLPAAVVAPARRRAA